MSKNITIAVLLGELINPRMEKRLKAESKIAEVHLISWDRGSSNMLNLPSEDGYLSDSILLKAKGDPFRRMIPYAKFIHFAKKKLRGIKPNIIHAQNLDMLKIGVWYKKHVDKNVKLIYEIADLHNLLVDEQKKLIRKIAREYLLAEDKRCSKEVDMLVVTSEKYYETYFKSFVEKERVLYMPNVPDLTAFSLYKRKRRGEEFVIGFIGAVRYKNQMKNLIEAGKNTGVSILFAGVEYEPIEIEPICQELANVEWYGKFDYYTDVAKLYEKCDVIYSVYDADWENVKVALPNKLYEAIYCELPIIVAKGTYLAELVETWGVGLAVSHKNINELCDAIIMLRDNEELYNGIVKHCRSKKESIDLNRNNQLFLNRIRGLMSDC